MRNREDHEDLVFPPQVEASIQKLIKNTGFTRDEVIRGLVMGFFEKVDQPGENVTEFVQMVRRALRELDAGG